MNPARTYLGASEVAEVFEVAVSTVNRWASNGKIPGYKTPGGTWRFDPEKISELRRQMTEQVKAS